MFKRFVNNQALLNGLKQIKRSDNNEQQQIVIAGNQSTGIIVPLSATPNTGIELQDFCNTLVPADSAIFKIAKQICEEQGSRIKQIAIEVLKDSGLNTTNINNNSSSNSNNTKNNSSLVKTSSSIPSLTHNGQPSVIISEETKTPTKPIVKTHGKFYGTNKMFLLDEEEIVNISGIPSSTPPIISNNMETSDTIPSTQTSQSLNLDIVKRLLSDIFGKLKYLAMVLLNSLFGNRQSVQSDAATTQVAAQSLVLVISFMIYNIVAESSSADLHHDILQVFQEYLSNHLNNQSTLPPYQENNKLSGNTLEVN